MVADHNHDPESFQRPPYIVLWNLDDTLMKTFETYCEAERYIFEETNCPPNFDIAMYTDEGHIMKLSERLDDPSF